MRCTQVHKTRPRGQKIVIILAVLMAAVSILPQVFRSGAALQNVEDVLMIPGLENNTFTWSVDKAFGIFADPNYHVGNTIQARVVSADTTNYNYTSTFQVLGWGNTSYFPLGKVTYQSYYFVARSWVNVSQQMLLNDTQAYWKNTTAVGQSISYTYQTEFIENALIDTVQINIDLNDTNWFHLKYSQAEGILLSIDVHVHVPDGVSPGVPLTGDFQLTHTGQTYPFAVTAWNYIFWFAIIFGIVIVILSGFSIVFTGMQEAAIHGKKIIDKPKVEMKVFIALILMIVGLVYDSSFFGVLVAIIGIGYLTYGIMVLPDKVYKAISGVVLFYFVTVGVPLLITYAETTLNIDISTTSPVMQGILQVLGANVMSLIALIIGALGALYGIFVRIKAWNAAQKLA